LPLWLLFGLLWGVIALYNPSLLLFLPCVGIWLLRDPARTVAAQLHPAAAAALVCLALFTPWMVRNYRVFHHFIPARTNLGVELCIANCWGVNGVLGVIDQPAVSAPAFAHYARVGDYQYGRDKMADFKAAVRRSPAKFAGLTLLRIDLYWFGIPGRYANPWKDAARLLAFCPFSITGIWGTVLAWRRRRPAAGLYLLALAILPIPYYFATLLARYRHPIEPILIAASAYLVLSAQFSWRVRPFSRVIPSEA
jgi:4-amino-4-deoxy-L-arabinose transferase-like glycosyltransferase